MLILLRDDPPHRISLRDAAVVPATPSAHSFFDNVLMVFVVNRCVNTGLYSWISVPTFSKESGGSSRHSG